VLEKRMSERKKEMYVRVLSMKVNKREKYACSKVLRKTLRKEVLGKETVKFKVPHKGIKKTGNNEMS
jgi:hypothetical protein